MKQNYYDKQKEKTNMPYEKKLLYDCYNKGAEYKSDRHWMGKIESIIKRTNGFEATISGKSSGFHLIVGESEWGKYLCIPTWGIGCELASYEDTFWNTERLSRLISKPDAITVVNGIRMIAQLLN